MRRHSYDRAEPKRSHVLSVGSYDGVHRLHRRALQSLREVGERYGCNVGLGLYEGRRANDDKQLTTMETRLELIEQTGYVDDVWIFPDEALHSDPRTLIGDWLVDLEPVGVGVPLKFSVGDGDTSVDAEHIRVVAERHSWQFLDLETDLPGGAAAQRLYTTEYIRALLQEGRLRIAGRLLGRLYGLSGEVVRGDQRGSQLGFPTANVALDESVLVPGDGVWSGVAVIESGACHPAAISFGRRETFYDDGKRILEAHLVGFGGDLYDAPLEVLFIDELRPQRSFETADQLAEQVRIDIAAVMELDPVATYHASRTW